MSTARFIRLLANKDCLRQRGFRHVNGRCGAKRGNTKTHKPTTPKCPTLGRTWANPNVIEHKCSWACHRDGSMVRGMICQTAPHFPKTNCANASNNELTHAFPKLQTTNACGTAVSRFQKSFGVKQRSKTGNANGIKHSRSPPGLNSTQFYRTRKSLNMAPARLGNSWPHPSDCTNMS